MKRLLFLLVLFNLSGIVAGQVYPHQLKPGTEGDVYATDTDGVTRLQKLTVPDYASLSTLSGAVKAVEVTDPVVGGVFVYDPTATNVDGGVVVSANWRRQFEGNIKAVWFGLNPEDNNDDTQALEAADDYAQTVGKAVELPGYGTVILENAVLQADLIGRGETIIPLDNAYDYIITFQGERIEGIKFDQTEFINGSGRKTALRVNGSKDFVMRDIFIKSPQEYLGSTSYAIDLLRRGDVSAYNVTIDSADYGGIRLLVSDDNYDFNNIKFRDPRRGAFSTIGLAKTLTRPALAGQNVVYTDIPPRRGSVFILDHNTGGVEQGFTVSSFSVEGDEYAVVLSGNLTEDVTDQTKYITPMGTLTLSNIYVDRTTENADINFGSGGFTIDPTESILAEVFVNNMSIDNAASNSAFKFDYVEKAYISNSVFYCKNEIDFGTTSEPFSISLIDMAEVNTVAMNPELYVSNTNFSGRILNSGFDIYASNTVFDVSHLSGVAASYNITFGGSASLTANGCRFLGCNSGALVGNGPGVFAEFVRISNSEYESSGAAGASLIGNLFAEISDISELKITGSGTIAPSFGEAENVSRGGNPLPGGANSVFGVGRIFKGNGIPDGRNFQVGDVYFNASYNGEKGSQMIPFMYRCLTSGNPGIWEPIYINGFNDLHVDNDLKVENQINVADAGIIKQNPSGGGMMIQPAFNAANQFGISIHNFSGTEIVVFDDGGNANFKTRAEFNAGLTVLGGALSMNGNRLAGLPAPAADNDPARRIDLDNAIASAQGSDSLWNGVMLEDIRTNGNAISDPLSLYETTFPDGNVEVQDKADNTVRGLLTVEQVVGVKGSRTKGFEFFRGDSAVVIVHSSDLGGGGSVLPNRTPTTESLWSLLPDGNFNFIPVSSLPTETPVEITASTDASGDVVVTHGVGTVPGAILLTLGMVEAYELRYHDKNGTDFKVRVLDANGAPVASTSVTFTWVAYK